MKPPSFQRIGSVSNANAGKEFEGFVRDHFVSLGSKLLNNHAIPIGLGDNKKLHRFDLGSDDPAVLVECKSHTWTESGNMPSAKLTVWNEAMFYFHLAPTHYRKMFFVLLHKHEKRKESLAEYYLRLYAHLIPKDVEIWEFAVDEGIAQRLR